MNRERKDIISPLSTTPPKQLALPPTPPGTVERPASTLESVHDLRRRWESYSQSKGEEANEIQSFKIDKNFVPHQHLDEIGRIFRRFDCYPARIRARMPSPIHELVIAGLESNYTEQRFQRCRGEYADIRLGRSSRIFLDGKKESRQPDIQFRHKSNRIPGIVIEVAHTQTEKELEALAYDYILKTDGNIKRVYGIDLNPLGKSSTISEWRARLSPSNDPDFDEEVRVEKTFKKEFRTIDGSPANPDEYLVISLSDFGTNTNAQDRDIVIPFLAVFEAYNEALQMETTGVPEDGAERRPAKRVKRIGRTPSPIERLRPEDEAKFQAAEEAAEHIGEQSDFEPSTDDAQETSSDSQ